MVIIRKPPHHLVLCGLMLMTVISACMASPDGDVGSAEVMHMDTEDDEDGKIPSHRPTSCISSYMRYKKLVRRYKAHKNNTGSRTMGSAVAT